MIHWKGLNARFNIGKLGCICHRYQRNFHGDMGGINAGLPTDRFEVEWWVTSNRVQSRANQAWRPLKLDALLSGGAVLVNEATFNEAGLPVPPEHVIQRPSNLLLVVEIPANFQAIKQKDFALAKRWREHTGTLFEALFANQFMVTDFVTHSEDEQGQRSFYLLTRQDTRYEN
jgi:predicted GNAT superfamily acetyltransferase